MKFSLFMIMCSLIAGDCTTPHQMDTYYNDMYSCLNAGYEESLNKSKEIGKSDINEFNIYMKFVCVEEEVIIPPEKPV